MKISTDIIKAIEFITENPYVDDFVNRCYQITNQEGGDNTIDSANYWHNQYFIVIKYLISQLPAQNAENIIENHKCIPIAKACMGEGRDWWCGELTEQVKEFPLETHCLHMKTPYKDVVFLCNIADLMQLQLLATSITGEINSSWFKTMLKVVKTQANNK